MLAPQSCPSAGVNSNTIMAARIGRSSVSLQALQSCHMQRAWWSTAFILWISVIILEGVLCPSTFVCACLGLHSVPYATRGVLIQWVLWRGSTAYPTHHPLTHTCNCAACRAIRRLYNKPCVQQPLPPSNSDYFFSKSMNSLCVGAYYRTGFHIAIEPPDPSENTALETLEDTTCWSSWREVR